MTDETAAIQQDIEATRAALAQKLEAIESRITDTVEGVSDTVQETVAQVKQAFDFKQQMHERPWVMFGASFVAGLVLGSLGGADEPQRGAEQQRLSGGTDRSRAIADVVSSEFSVIKQAAFATVSSMARDAIKGRVPQLADQVERLRTTRSQQQHVVQAALPASPNVRVYGDDEQLSDAEVLDHYLTQGSFDALNP